VAKSRPNAVDRLARRDHEASVQLRDVRGRRE
jgi:hypothetical protein